MSNDHVHPTFQSLLNDIREATQTLANCAAKGALKPDGTRQMPIPGWDVPRDYYASDEEPEPMKIVIERSPYPNTEPQYRWTAYYEGREDELSKTGMTPDEALSRFLIAVTNRDEPEID